MLKSFKGKKVLITGISGFVGSHLAKRMQNLGADVYGISKSKEDNKILKADILEKTAVDNYMKKSGIQIVFHLAGESLVESGQDDPYKTFKLNIDGTLNILELARKHRLQKVIIASTAHVYGRNRLPYYEGYTPRPTRPYETSKACTDLMAQAYANSFNLPVLIPRFVNIYGPGDLHFERLIPKTIKAVLKNLRPSMWGGEVVRDYLYIDDAINGYLKIAAIDIDKAGYNRVFNFGTGCRTPVRELINKIILIANKNLTIKKITELRNEEIKSQYVSSNKAVKILGWRAETELDDGLEKTINWYKEYFKA